MVCVAPYDEYSEKLVNELNAEYVGIKIDGKSLNPIEFVTSLLCLFSVINRYKPKYIFNFTIKMNVYVGLAALLKNVPYANNVSGLGTVFLHKSLKYKLIQKLYGFVSKRASHVFFQNADDLDVFLSSGLLGSTSYTVLPGSGINLERFVVSPLLQSIEIKFLMIARLVADKGVREFVEASRILQNGGWRGRCILVGPMGVNNVSAIPEEEVAEWKANNLVDYRGSLADVRDVISGAHVLVLPSYREGLPRTVLEAAAIGRPAIVSDVPGCRHAIVPGETGWLCRARDALSLAEIMNEVSLLGVDVLQDYGARARLEVEQRFSEEIVVNSYCSLLD